MVMALAVLVVAMAGPQADRKVPRNKATVILVIDVSRSMDATDVSPSRLKAAQEAGKKFADELTEGINLGLDLLRGHGDHPGLTDPEPPGHQRRHRQAARSTTRPRPVRASSPR